MLKRIAALVRRYERDTEGRLRLELAATKAALRDALRERAEGAAALMDAVRERDAWRTRIPEALGGRLPVTDQLGVTVERIERLMAAYQVCRESERTLRHGLEEIEGALMGRPNPPFSVLEDVVAMAHKMRARRDRWRARVQPSEDRVVALTKELRATQGRLRQAERQAARERDAAQAGPSWLSDAARVLGQVAPDGAAKALNWTQVLEAIRAARARAESLEDCGGPNDFCSAEDGGCVRHWGLRNIELVRERDRARAELGLTVVELHEANLEAGRALAARDDAQRERDEAQATLATVRLEAAKGVAQAVRKAVKADREAVAGWLASEGMWRGSRLARVLRRGGGEGHALPPPLPEVPAAPAPTEAPEVEIILRHPAGHGGLVDERGWHAPLPEDLQRAMTGALALIHLLHGCAAPAEVQV